MMKISVAMFMFSFLVSVNSIKGPTAQDPKWQKCNNIVDSGLDMWNNDWNTVVKNHFPIAASKSLPSCFNCYISRKGDLRRSTDATFTNDGKFTEIFTGTCDTMTIHCDCDYKVGDVTHTGKVTATVDKPQIKNVLVFDGKMLILADVTHTTRLTDRNLHVNCQGDTEFQDKCNNAKTSGAIMTYVEDIGQVFNLANVDTSVKLHWLHAVSCEDIAGGGNKLGGTKLVIENTLKIYS